MQVEFHPQAARQIYKSALSYEKQIAGLGYRYIEQIELSTDLLNARPESGKKIDKKFRHLALHQFPFSLIYSIEADRIRIVTVHNRMQPAPAGKRVGNKIKPG